MSYPSDTHVRYTVRPGDTMWSICQRHKAKIDDVVKCNKHIRDPKRIKHGDVIFIPRPITIVTPTTPPAPKVEIITDSRCILLMPIRYDVPQDAMGTALIRILRKIKPSNTSISILASSLPSPSHFGHFDSYEGTAFISQETSWSWPLYPTPESIPTWSGTFNKITTALTKATTIQVRPINTNTGQKGEPVLSGIASQQIR